MASCLQNLLRGFLLMLVSGGFTTVFLLYLFHFSKPLPHIIAFQEWTTSNIPLTRETTTQTPFNMTSLPACPNKPLNISEPVKLNLTNISLDELQTKYPSLPGDRYRPDGCRSGQRLAVVIPYRDREQHLGILLNNLIPFLKKQQADFTIFVAEQAPGGVFNRGLMINAGVEAALKEDNFTCLVLHDVDLIPEISDNYYRCREKPIHLSTANSKYGYTLPYASYVGGNVAIKTSQYRKINGFSNLYFGWGGEDDDFGKRMATFGLRVERNSHEIGRYHAQSHGKDKGNPLNPKREILLGRAVGRLRKDGLLSTHVNTTVSHRGALTLLKVSIDKQFYASNPGR